MDKHSAAQRSYNMSRIRSQDTKPEVLVRKYLFSKGYRYRKNVKSLPGSPDIVLPKYKTVVFIQGCFWHMHNCDKFRWPSTNSGFWRAKITKNAERDFEVQKKLKEIGWNVIVIWECDLAKEKRDNTFANLVRDINSQTVRSDH